jgi:DNA-binding PadR family transcriptional regulator
MNDLAKKKYIKCLNPEDKTYRLYKISAKGKKALEKAKQIKN